MPHKEIPFLPHQYYHFYYRGNNRQAVFFGYGLKIFPSHLLTITVSSVDKKKASHEGPPPRPGFPDPSFSNIIQ
jgi:hypothetical protein